MDICARINPTMKTTHPKTNQRTSELLIKDTPQIIKNKAYIPQSILLNQSMFSPLYSICAKI